MNAQRVMRRWPRIVAHVIAESLGYATPTCAALIVRDAKDGKENWCEWVASCFNGNAREVVRRAIASRNTHHGYMAEYKLARTLVDTAINDGTEPLFASWF